MQKGPRPVKHLKFADYRVGNYAMVCVIPKATTLGWIDHKYRKVNLKLQMRYAGPYLIIKKISPVVYVLKVDDVERIFAEVKNSFDNFSYSTSELDKDLNTNTLEIIVEGMNKRAKRILI
jgi:hypothetical protein